MFSEETERWRHIGFEHTFIPVGLGTFTMPLASSMRNFGRLTAEHKISTIGAALSEFAKCRTNGADVFLNDFFYQNFVPTELIFTEYSFSK